MALVVLTRVREAGVSSLFGGPFARDKRELLERVEGFGADLCRFNGSFLGMEPSGCVMDGRKAIGVSLKSCYCLCLEDLYRTAAIVLWHLAWRKSFALDALNVPRSQRPVHRNGNRDRRETPASRVLVIPVPSLFYPPSNLQSDRS